MADDKSWNLWHGCRKYSTGCCHCYMYALDAAHGVPEKSGVIKLTRDFRKPLAKDRRGNFKIPAGFILRVNMTSDTFWEEADNWREEMWDIIRRRPDILFYILTKRVPRIRECLLFVFVNGLLCHFPEDIFILAVYRRHAVRP